MTRFSCCPADEKLVRRELVIILVSHRKIYVGVSSWLYLEHQSHDRRRNMAKTTVHAAAGGARRKREQVAQ